jgi:transcriptional regulator with XRE-family HTH domain
VYVGSGQKDPWTEYLESLLARPEWNVARLAQASGIHRATIYRWLRGDIKNITVESVRMIAKGGEGSLAAALTAARSHTLHEPVDTADEDDYEVRLIRESGLSESAKHNLYAHLARRRTQLREEIEALIRTNEPEPHLT